MPKLIRLPDQSVGQFSDEWTDEQISTQIARDFPDAYKAVAPPEEPGTLLGMAQHVGVGALKTLVDIPATVVKAVAGPVALIEKGVGKLMGKEPQVDPATKFMLDKTEAAQAWAEQKLEGLSSSPDISVGLGLIQLPIGGTIGGVLPFALGGAGAAAKVEGTLKAVGTSMLDAGVFTAGFEIPKIITAPTWKEATERAKTAAVTIPFGAVLAGGLTSAGRTVGWAREKLGSHPEAKAQVVLEKGLPNTEDLGANQPRVTPFDEIHGEEVKVETTAKAARLKDNIEKTAYAKAEEAFTDATARMEAAKTLAHEETEALRVSEVTDPLLYRDQMTLKAKKIELIERGKEFAADVQRSVAPISRLDGWKEKQPFVNFEGKLEYYEKVIAPTYKKALVEALPDLPSRQLVTLVRDAAGNEKVLAILRSERVKAAIDSTETLYDQLFKAGVEGDVFTPEIQRANFVNRIYGPRDAEHVNDFLAKKRPLDAKNPHSMKRVFDDIEAAANAGWKPATLDIADLQEAYGRSLMQSLARGQLIKDVTTLMPGKVMWAEKAPEGMAPLSDRIRQATRTTTRMKDEVEVKTTERLYANKDIHHLLSAVMDPSITRLKPALNAFEKVNTQYKMVMLSLDVYHYANVTRNAAALGHFNPKRGLEMLDPLNSRHPLAVELIQNGLNLGRSDWGNRAYMKAITETGIQKNLGAWFEKSPIGMFNHQLWDVTHRGFKILTAVSELQKYLADPKMTAKYSRAELANKAASFSNNVFGGMSWSMRGRTQTFNSLLRMVALAPDWLESRMNLAAGVLRGGPEGASSRRFWGGFLAQTAMVGLVGNAVMQQVDPNLKNHPESQGVKGLLNVVVPLYDGRGHPLIVGLGGSFQYALDFLTNTGTFLSNRQAALLRVGMEFATQRDWTGKKIAPELTSKENFLHLGKNLVPIPLFLQLADIEFNAAGVENLKNKQDVARQLARSFGTHPTSGYPADLRRHYNYLEDRRDVVMSKARKLVEAGRVEMAREEIRKYNDEVKGLMTESEKVYRGPEIGVKVRKLAITR